MTRPWYDDLDRIERMREQSIELHLLDCPAWRRIEAEYRIAYDTSGAELVQPVHVLLWADSMIQRARRLGDPARARQQLLADALAGVLHAGARPGGGTMTLHIEPYDTARAAGLRASHVRAEQCAEVLGILQHESSGQYILVYLA